MVYKTVPMYVVRRKCGGAAPVGSAAIPIAKKVIVKSLPWGRKQLSKLLLTLFLQLVNLYKRKWDSKKRKKGGEKKKDNITKAAEQMIINQIRKTTQALINSL